MAPLAAVILTIIFTLAAKFIAAGCYCLKPFLLRIMKKREPEDNLAFWRPWSSWFAFFSFMLYFGGAGIIETPPGSFDFAFFSLYAAAGFTFSTILFGIGIDQHKHERVQEKNASL